MPNANCSWILRYTTESCGRKCSKRGNESFCAYHNNLIKKDHMNRVCSVCGIGVISKFNLCAEHAVDKRKEAMNVHNKNNNALRAEWNRLKRIN